MNNNIEKISNSIAIISIGLVCLFVTLGYFSLTDIWNFFATFWPIFIILGGIKLLFGAFKFGKYLNIVVDILFFLALILGIFFYPQIESKFFSPDSQGNSNQTYEFVIEQKDYDLKEIKNIEYKIEVGAIEFNLNDTSDEYFEVKGNYQSNFFEPNIDSDLVNGILAVGYSQNIKGVFSLRNISNLDSKFDFSLVNNVLPKSLELNLGAGKGDISLINSNLNRVILNVGAGELTLSLPKDSGYTFTSNVGAGQVRIRNEGKLVKEIVGFEGDSVFELGNTPKTPIFLNVGAGKIVVELK